LAATQSRSRASLSSEPECEFPTRVFFVEQINGSLDGGDRPEKVAEQLMSPDHADLCPVIAQSALASLGTLDEDLTDDWGQLRAPVLMTQAHGGSMTVALTAKTEFQMTVRSRR